PILDGDGPDITIREEGQMGETALILLSDGHSRTYPLGIATIPNERITTSTICEFDIHQVDPGFVPTAIRILSLGLGGGSPGFDVGEVQARIAVDASRPYGPGPADMAIGISPTQTLRWSASGVADTVDVFLGTDPNAADPSLAASVVSLPGYATSFTPNALLRTGHTYFWRIVEHLDSASRTSDLWQFTVSPFLDLEDFESYAHIGELSAWYSNPRSSLKLTHSCDEVFRGCHGIAMDYEFAGGQKSSFLHYYFSETHWTDPSLGFLELSFRGLTSNPPGHTILLGLGTVYPIQVTYEGDPNHMRDGQWHTWRIDLSRFSNLRTINTMELGVQALPDTPSAQSTCTIYFDEIHLASEGVFAPAAPEPLQTDLDQDEQLTPKDLALFSEAWLRDALSVLAVQEPAPPWCYLPFEGTILDAQGNAQTHSSVTFQIKDNQYANFNSPNATLNITNGRVLNQFTHGITISFWQSGTPSIHRADTLVCSDYAYPHEAPEIAIGLGLWEEPEALCWHCGAQPGPNNSITGIHQASEQWSDRWNHWAFAKDFLNGQIAIYLNGTPLYEGQGQATGLTRVETLALGNGWYRDYDGLMDDFRIHDYALNAQECAFLATNGSGVLPHPAVLPSDFNQDGQVDWHDFASLASEWVN
ncbi:MAG: LamG domain-containing protein, partial [Planctomycetes bacterium]|nr:LamG domain-containing protein [Planctomycetota bacterium]